MDGLDPTADTPSMQRAQAEMNAALDGIQAISARGRQYGPRFSTAVARELWADLARESERLRKAAQQAVNLIDQSTDYTR